MNIKFRAWDTEGKRYIENTGNPYIFPFNGITAMKCAGSSCGTIDGETDYSEFYVIEYWTGLLDKSGKEIYEGDIVRDEHGRIMEIIWCSDYKCDYDRSHFARYELKLLSFNEEFTNNFKTTDLTSWYNNKTGTMNFEIIGNVHTNPELLEKG